MLEEEITDFVIKNGDGLYLEVEREDIKNAVKKHLEYGTFLTVRDKEGIVAVARWNWLTENTVHILDVVIKKEYRKPRRLRELLALGVANNPSCKYMVYEDKQLKRRRIYSVNKFLKRRQ